MSDTTEQLRQDLANAREQRDQWHQAFEKMQEGYRRVYIDRNKLLQRVEELERVSAGQSRREV